MFGKFFVQYNYLDKYVDTCTFFNFMNEYECTHVLYMYVLRT